MRELYNQRGKPKTFSSLDTFYRYCQNLGINEELIQISKKKDGVI